MSTHGWLAAADTQTQNCPVHTTIANKKIWKNFIRVLQLVFLLVHCAILMNSDLVLDNGISQMHIKYWSFF